MPESPRIDAERVLAGRYHLRRLIARGGMAEVWEATDDILGRPVAVKILLPDLAADALFLERFRREAIAAARLAHPNVVGTFDTGIDAGDAYIVMEYVAGHTLQDVLAVRGPLAPHRAVAIAVQVLAALDYAHQHGVVHRDVKPANILITDDDRVKVADFGIAKAAERFDGDGRSAGPTDLTQNGMIIGTAKYLSPEQVNGDHVDGRADLYSLGVVLYEMLCGRPPFTGGTDMQIALRHASEAPPSPRQLRAGIPRSLEIVVLRALAKAPNERFANAGAMQSALLSIDLGPDDAVPLVVRDPTPPGGIATPTFRQSEQTWLYPTAIIVVLAVALGVIGVLFATSDTGRRLLNPSASTPKKPQVTVTGASSFDPPPGDGVEHDEELANLIDGDPSTVWMTETYNTPNFGGLKPGVGFILQLAGPSHLDDLTITSQTQGWSVSVYTADASQSTLAGWGDAVATKSDITDSSTTLALHNHAAGAVLVWITNLGPSDQVVVGDVKLTGTADNG